MRPPIAAPTARRNRLLIRTGFSSAGATIEDVKLLRANVSEKMGVKASGGIRDLAAALAMIEAGATRLGTSSGVAIVQGTDGGAGKY